MSKQFSLGILKNKHQKITSFQISFNYFTSFFGESDGKRKKKGLTEMGKSPTVVWRLDQLDTWQGRQYPGCTNTARVCGGGACSIGKAKLM